MDQAIPRIRNAVCTVEYNTAGELQCNGILKIEIVYQPE